MEMEKRDALTRAPKARKPRRPHRYTGEEKAAALECVNLNGGIIARAAKECGIPEMTLRQWSRGQGVSEAIYADYVAKKGGLLTNRLWVLADQIVDALSDEECIKTASLVERARAFGIVFDKVWRMDKH